MAGKGVPMQARVDVLGDSARRWWLALGGVSLLFALAYAVIPQRYVALRELGIYNAVTTASWIAVLIGVRRYRPTAPRAWLLIGFGLLAWSLGDLAWSLYEVAGAEVPYPSVADVFYVSGYPLVAAGLAVAVRARRIEPDWRVVLDTTALVLAGSLVVWVYVIQPVLDETDASALSKATSIVYPTGDVILTGFAALLFLGTTWRAVSMQLLVLGLGITLVADVAYYTDLSLRGVKVLDAFYLVSLTMIMLAALHPSMRALTDPLQESSVTDSRKRLGLLGFLLAVPPVVLVVQAAHDAPLYLRATIPCALLLILVALLRFERMLADVRRSELAARTLSRFSAGLTTADDRSELLAAADQTARELVRHGKAGVVEPPDPPGTPHALATPVNVEGVPVAEIVADVGPRELAAIAEALASVASQLAVTLERMVAVEREQRLVTSLRERNEQLAELDQMKNRFVSSTSHELRTPLTSIIGYVELLVAGEAGELGDEQRHFLEIVNRNCERLKRLVDDVLLVGRADADRLTLEPSEVDLTELVRAEVASHEAAARLKGIVLRGDVQDGLPVITGDATRLTQMLDNLLANAIKFTPGGGTVTAELAGDDGQLRIAVADTGVGIPADEVPKVFDRFYRASTATAVSGTGLGLPIVQAIAEAHGGTVSVASDVGVGTTFTVELPVNPPARTQIMRATPEKEATTT